MDRLTRKELKTDKFATEVGHTVQFLEQHRRQATIIGGAIVVLAILAVGAYFYMGRQHAARQALLVEALRLYAVPSGNEDPYVKSFSTEEEKWSTVQPLFQTVIDEHSGTDEAAVAHMFLGVIASDRNSPEEAEEHFKRAIDAGSEEYASQATLSLADVYAGLGRYDEAEALLRNLVEHPTTLVSKEQATIALAEVLAQTKPEEARSLLEPLRTERPEVSRAALAVLGRLDASTSP